MPLPGCSVPTDGPLCARRYTEPAHAYRHPFERDRGRILHSRAFRRMAGKTQVFTHRYSDHFRSRLTHTLEVAQIARTAARALALNEDLAEALALVHDIGHPPFGHAGERALDAVMREYGLRFDHNLHALRIVEHFEIRYAAFPGINLTLAVREGIIKHSRDYFVADHPELAEYFLDQRPPLEAQIIDLADEIAYLTADFDDGFEAEILTPSHVSAHVRLFEQFHTLMREEFPAAPERLISNETLKRMLNALTSDLIAETTHAAHAAGATTLEAVRAAPNRLAVFSPAMEELRMEAKRYLYANLYNSPDLAPDHEEAQKVTRTLFETWTANPALLPAGQQPVVEADGAPQAIADFIAGMTDQYALAHYEEITRK